MNKIIRLRKIENKINEIKHALTAIGEMRPGSLSLQYNVCGKPDCKCKDKKNPKKHGPYNQLSYVIKGKSTSQYIRDEHLEGTTQQINNYRVFKGLVDEWTELALEHAKLKIEVDKERKKAV